MVGGVTPFAGTNRSPPSGSPGVLNNAHYTHSDFVSIRVFVVQIRAGEWNRYAIIDDLLRGHAAGHATRGEPAVMVVSHRKPDRFRQRNKFEMIAIIDNKSVYFEQ